VRRSRPRIGRAQADARSVARAAIASRTTHRLHRVRKLLAQEIELDRHAIVVDAKGGAVVPGFVDATPTSSSPATAVRNCDAGCPARRTRRLRRRAAAFSALSSPPAPLPMID